MEFGDHIAVLRNRPLLPPYRHHGIYVGNGCVIHLTKKDAKVLKTSVTKFLKGKNEEKNEEVEVVEYIRFTDQLINYKNKIRSLGGVDYLLPLLNDEQKDEVQKRIEDPGKAVIEARKYLGRPGYGFFSNNCEHFAVFCKTGLRISFQVIEQQILTDRIVSNTNWDPCSF